MDNRVEAGPQQTPAGNETARTDVDSRAVSRGQRLATWKDATATIQSIATIAAFLAAGVWFSMQGVDWPHASFDQTVQSLQLDDKHTYVTLDVHIKNIGQIPLKLRSATVDLRQILPVPAGVRTVLDKGGDAVDKDYLRVLWPPLRSYTPQLNLTIWPGEEEHRHYDFVISADVCEVGLHSYFPNERDPRLGWAVSTLYSIKECPK